MAHSAAPMAQQTWERGEQHIPRSVSASIGGTRQPSSSPVFQAETALAGLGKDSPLRWHQHGRTDGDGGSETKAARCCECPAHTRRTSCIPARPERVPRHLPSGKHRCIEAIDDDRFHGCYHGSKTSSMAKKQRNCKQRHSEKLEELDVDRLVSGTRMEKY